MLIGTMAKLIETPANAGVPMYVVAKLENNYTVAGDPAEYCQTLKFDPKKVWKTLKNFDYPDIYTKHIEHLQH